MRKTINLGQAYRNTFFNEKIFKNINYFYVHLNKANIAARTLSATDLTSTYKEQRNNVLLALQQDYKNLLNNQLNGQSIQALSAVMNIDENEFMQRLNQTVKQKLQAAVNDSKLGQLHEKSVSLKEKLSDIIKDDKVNLDNLKTIFKLIKESINLFGKSASTDALGAALTMAMQSIDNGVDVQTIGGNLQTALENYQAASNMATIKKESLEKAAAQLSNLGYALKEGHFKSTGSKLSSEGLATLIGKLIISTDLAQGLAICSTKKATQLVAKTIKSVGTKSVETFFDEEYDSEKIPGKTDVQITGMKMSLEAKDLGQNSVDFELDIGISSKFYSGQQFNAAKTPLTGTFSSGSGGSLSQAIKTIWTGYDDRYLIYNYITHGIYTKEINSLLASRELVRLFASAGSKDFAGFMILNGKVISIWELIQYAMNHDLFKSRSMLGQNGKQAIALTIQGREKIIAGNVQIPVDPDNKATKTKMLAAWQRARNLNTLFDSARIKAELHLDALASAMGPKF